MRSSVLFELNQARSEGIPATREEKKNYAERFSRALAQRFANELRRDFPEILPDVDGQFHESRARTAKGTKKLDVNFSTADLGLGFGLSIKTVNFPDPKSGRYTKNFTRIDNELRAEAHDYHERQPFAVLVGILFLPEDSCDDHSTKAPSSFGSAVQIFRFRASRSSPTDSEVLFERFFIGIYGILGQEDGCVGFFDVRDKPPRGGRPATLLSLEEVVNLIAKAFNDRNNPTIEWA